MPLKEPTELFHYTGIAGLRGILKSQTLWATHYQFLNDAEEVIHFKPRMEGLILSALEQVQGGERPSLNQTDMKIEAKKFVECVYKVLFDDTSTPPLLELYITSFCKAENKNVARDGLLSQWRGYGQDGGYAIVFKESALHRLVDKENKQWRYSFLNAGNVVYADDLEKQIRQKTRYHDELKKAFVSYFAAPNKTQELLEKTYEPVVAAACRFKHEGFKEEKEFRIVAGIRQQGSYPRKKPIKCVQRSGTAVPYINLFEGITSLPAKPLPIKRIIVGPHQEKEKRKKAIEILLKELGIKAEVSVSEIPYLGQ